MSDPRKALITYEEYEAFRDVIIADIERRNDNLSDTDKKATAALNRMLDTFEAYEPGAIETAREQYGRDGECEIDDGAVCSRGDDPGLYVQAWVWVDDEEEE